MLISTKTRNHFLFEAFYEKVLPVEFFNMNWQKNERETLAPNISAFTRRFNQVSYWVATEVVTAPTQKQRIEVLKKFIKSGKVTHT